MSRQYVVFSKIVLFTLLLVLIPSIAAHGDSHPEDTPHPTEATTAQETATISAQEAAAKLSLDAQRKQQLWLNILIGCIVTVGILLLLFIVLSRLFIPPTHSPSRRPKN